MWEKEREENRAITKFNWIISEKKYFFSLMLWPNSICYGINMCVAADRMKINEIFQNLKQLYWKNDLL